MNKSTKGNNKLIRLAGPLLVVVIVWECRMEIRSEGGDLRMLRVNTGVDVPLGLALFKHALLSLPFSSAFCLRKQKWFCQLPMTPPSHSTIPKFPRHMHYSALAYSQQVGLSYFNHLFIISHITTVSITVWMPSTWAWDWYGNLHCK